MTRKDFFEINMKVCDWDASGNDEKVLRPLIEHLAKQPDETIFCYDEIMAELLFELDTKQIFQRACQYAPQTDDAFLYSRCCALVNGEAYYEKVKDGSSNELWEMEFEAILYVPMLAWAMKYGEDADNYPYMTTKSYETGSNTEGWKQCESYLPIQ